MDGVTEMSEVVDVAEELVVQLGEADDWDGAVLVEGARVALQPGAEVGNMGGDLLDHHAPERQEMVKVGSLGQTHLKPRRLASDLISQLQMASGVSNSPRKISEKRSAS